MAKAQDIRLWDVYVLGPFLIWAASRALLPPWARTAMIAAGVGTVLYNAHTYMQEAELRREGSEGATPKDLLDGVREALLSRRSGFGPG